MLQTKIIEIVKVSFVSDEMRGDCYHIANASSGDAENIYSTIKYDVNDQHHTMMVNDVNGVMRGFIKGHCEQLPRYVDIPKDLKSVKIDWLYVDKKYFGAGIGSALLQAYLGYEKGRGAQYAFLYSTPAKRSLDFYKKHQNFQTIGWNNLLGKFL